MPLVSAQATRISVHRRPARIRRITSSPRNATPNHSIEPPPPFPDPPPVFTPPLELPPPELELPPPLVGAVTLSDTSAELLATVKSFPARAVMLLVNVPVAFV